MTQAYIEGFCKTAEAYGVDPDALIKQALGPIGLLKLAPKALSAAKAMKAVRNLGWAPPQSLLRKGMDTSVMKNLSTLARRGDTADTLRTADSLYNKAIAAARAAGASPTQPSSSFTLREAPKGWLANARKVKLRKFLNRTYPGYDAGF